MTGGPTSPERLLKAMEGQLTFVVGDRKGAGKTTFLKYALAALRGSGDERVVSFGSIGVDGEQLDQAFGTPKPRITVESGDVVLTSESALEVSDAGFEGLDVGYTSAGPFGRWVIARCLRRGFVELHSPGNNHACREAVGVMRSYTPTVLIDGAVNRVTQLSGALDGGVVFVTSYDTAGSAKALRSLDRMQRLLSLPEAKAATGDVVLGGALTDSRWDEIPSEGSVVVEDFTRVFLSDRNLTKALGRLRVQRVFPVRGFVVNSPATRPLDWAHGCEFPVVWNPYEAVS